MKTTTSVLAAALLALAPAAAQAAPVPAGAKWSEATITSADGVKLHADVLRPKNLPATAKTPVVLSIGPYFGHAGQVGVAGPVEDAPYDPVGPTTGPSDRFADLVEGAKLMERGYTFVTVDLRGFGGSTGCLDWGGPGEQSDVVSAVRWAATQSWSTGKVGMYGKSYDGMTGLVGVNKQPAGLEAVVSQEPVYDLYRYLYGDGIRRVNSLLTPALYELIDATPGPAADFPNDPSYLVNGANDTQRPGCKALNLADQALDDDHFSAYWRPRNLIGGAKGSNVPLLLTQGLTENNTVADGMGEYLENHTGPERAWLGPWEHVRGNDRDADGRLNMGRKGWFDEVVRFYDQHLKGKAPTVADPPVAVQTNDGRWRSEQSWPPADAKPFTSGLKTGSYSNQGTAGATGSGAEEGVWTISRPLPADAHLAGTGRVVVDVTAAAPRANLVVDVYDLAPDGTGPLVTRQGRLVRANGQQVLKLWSADWKFKKGHRIGVRVADANADWWVHAPTLQTVRVEGGNITLPFLTYQRSRNAIDGAPGTQLEGYLDEKVTVPAETIRTRTSERFRVPPAQAVPPS